MPAPARCRTVTRGVCSSVSPHTQGRHPSAFLNFIHSAIFGFKLHEGQLGGKWPEWMLGKESKGRKLSRVVRVVDLCGSISQFVCVCLWPTTAKVLALVLVFKGKECIAL